MICPYLHDSEHNDDKTQSPSYSATSCHLPAEPVKNMFLSSSITIRSTFCCSALSQTSRCPAELRSTELLASGFFSVAASSAAGPGTVCLGAKNASSVVRWSLAGPFVLGSPELLWAFRLVALGLVPGITNCDGLPKGCLIPNSTFAGRWFR